LYGSGAFHVGFSGEFYDLHGAVPDLSHIYVVLTDEAYGCSDFLDAGHFGVPANGSRVVLISTGTPDGSPALGQSDFLNSSDSPPSYRGGFLLSVGVPGADGGPSVRSDVINTGTIVPTERCDVDLGSASAFRG
jgi:hypothetical protein